MFLAMVIICVFVSILFFLLGYLVWRKKQLSFIAGYNEQTFKGDKNKLAKAIGMYAIGIGVLTLFFPLSLEHIGAFTGMVYIIVIVLGTVATVIYVNAINKN